MTLVFARARARPPCRPFWKKGGLVIAPRGFRRDMKMKSGNVTCVTDRPEFEMCHGD